MAEKQTDPVQRWPVPVEQIINFAVIRGDGEEHLLALTSAGRMFERHRDARYFPQGPHDPKSRHLWREVPGPLDPA